MLQSVIRWPSVLFTNVIKYRWRQSFTFKIKKIIPRKILFFVLELRQNMFLRLLPTMCWEEPTKKLVQVVLELVEDCVSKKSISTAMAGKPPGTRRTWPAGGVKPKFSKLSPGDVSAPWCVPSSFGFYKPYIFGTTHTIYFKWTTSL